MEMQRSTEPDPLPVSDAGVVVAEGFGLRLYVRHGTLVVEDGEGPNGRRVRLTRAASKGKRVVLLGRAGSLSVEALRWCADAGVGVAVIDSAAGRVVVASASVLTDIPALRRLQAAAPERPSGLAVARFLIGRKVEGQLSVLRSLLPDAVAGAAEAEEAADAIGAAPTIAAVRLLEAQAAAAYWRAWGAVTMAFAPKDAGRIPAHWRTFGGRGSAITGAPRLASSPVNALLNYGYALGEVEARLALLALGLDPGLGIIHVDQRSRDSLGLDVLESIRPTIDRYVLGLVRGRPFRKADVYETTRGVFRVGADLARSLVETMPEWRREVGPVAERVAQMIAADGDRPIHLATRLTQDNRSRGRDRVRRGAPRLPTASPRLPNACRSCGVVLDRRDRVYCDECVPEVQARQRAAFSVGGPAVLAKALAEGRDLMHSPEARRKVGRANAKRLKEAREWDLVHERPEPEVFRREILPSLQEVSLRRIAAATGLDLSYCSMIRRGLHVPHPRHWEAMRTCTADAPTR